MAAFGAVGRFAVAGWREDIYRIALSAGDPIVLGEAASQIIAGATVAAVPAAVSLDDDSYLASAGVKYDFNVPDALALADAEYGPQSGASVTTEPGGALTLGEVEFDIPAGNRIDFALEDMVLGAVAYEAYSGVAIDFALPAALVAEEPEYSPGSGTVSSFMPADDLVVSDVPLSPHTGASVFVRPSFQEFYSSAVAATAVAGGFTVRTPRHFRLGTVVMAPQSGASPALGTEQLVLNDIAFEVGARRKPVRGQFLIYN